MSFKCALLFFMSVCSVNVYTQVHSFSDSIISSVKAERVYSKKINILQEGIAKIYATKFDETITLSRLGYTLANSRDDKVNKGDFLRRIGGAYGKKGNIDSASVYYYKALSELEHSKNSEKLGLLYDDMARMYRKLRQTDRALSFYNKALELYEGENNLEGIARIYNESGVVFRDEGNYPEANKRFEKSLSIQRQRQDSVGIGYSLEFLGYNQLLIKNYNKSESYLMQALEIRKKMKDDFALMLSYTALGEFYKETENYTVSTKYFQLSNSVAQKISFPDIQKYNYEQIVGNYTALKNFEEAFYSLKKFNMLNDSLYNAEKLKNVEEVTAKYETAEKEKQILVQRAKIAENDLRLKRRNQWIFGLISLAIIVSLLGFIVYKQQVLKNIKQHKDNELKLALEKIENQNRLQQQRLSISRDLHDNIGAQLSFIVSAIDTIKYYASDSNGLLTNRLDTIGTFAKETIQELRDTIWAMNKAGISIKDLQSRIANFIEKAKQSGSNVYFSVVADKSLPSGLKFSSQDGLNIFRIMQEATNNAFKYADASQIKIQILKEGSKLKFTIEDDGKGFIENESEVGNGLLNMRKRASELGSELIILSEEGVGTSISFYLNKTELFL